MKIKLVMWFTVLAVVILAGASWYVLAQPPVAGVTMEEDLELTAEMMAWVENARIQRGVHIASFNDGQRLVLVSQGPRPTTGYEMFVKNVVKGKAGQWVIYVSSSEPGPGEAQAQIVTYPYALLAIDDGDGQNPIRVQDSETGEAFR